MNDLLEAGLLGIVEGLTEFIPVSSTGHLILTERLLGRNGVSDSVFDVFIQIGAITAVLWARRARLFHMATSLHSDPKERGMAIKIVVAFLPAAILGFILHDFIKEVLFSPWVVGTSLIVGGIFMLFAERIAPPERVHDIDRISIRTALGIGLCQTLALIPGVSRAGASIVGARLIGVDNRAAAEFSFFLAIPTIFGAAAFDLLKSLSILSVDDIPSFAVGTLAAFLSALVVVNMLIEFVGKHGFVPFGWYRITAGVVVLALLYTGY